MKSVNWVRQSTIEMYLSFEWKVVQKKPWFVFRGLSSYMFLMRFA